MYVRQLARVAAVVSGASLNLGSVARNFVTYLGPRVCKLLARGKPGVATPTSRYIPDWLCMQHFQPLPWRLQSCRRVVSSGPYRRYIPCGVCLAKPIIGTIGSKLPGLRPNVSF